MINFDNFIKKHLNIAVDYDGVSGVQCVDLAKCYLDECFNIKAGAWGNAHAYFDSFNSHPELVKTFTKIANTPSLTFKKGDIVVWSKTTAHPYGHIAIADGIGDTSYFYSYDQNYGKKECQRIRHDFKGVAGILRPKDTTNLYKVVNKVARYGNATMIKGQTVYADSQLKNSIGSVAYNERVTQLGTGEGLPIIAYKISGGHYKTGFVKGYVKKD